MFEDLSKEAIQERILKLIPPDNDVSPHSPLYIITAPVAQGWALLYLDQEEVLKQIFFDTADREYLIKHAQNYGIEPYPATHSEVEGQFNIQIETGARFSKGEVNFTVTRYLRNEDGYYYYALECEQAGEVGNVSPGKILPIQFIDNLTYSYITRILVPAENEEETETFRERFIGSFKNKAFCANLADYYNELSAIEGVGKFKVLRCRNNKGEIEPEWVTIVFTDSLGKKPTEELVSQVQNTFQELDDNGLPSVETSGTGLSAIGQLCWVEGVKEETVNFGLNLTFEAESSWEILEETVREKLTERLNQYVLDDWGDTVVSSKSYKPMEYSITIKRAEIEAMLIGIDGIQDSKNIKINDNYENLKLSWNAIPKLGEITLYSDVESISLCLYDCPDCQCNHDSGICERCNGL